MNKEQLLNHWKGLAANQQINPGAVAYKHTGSTFDEDGIRITGSAQFIDSVLSRLKDMLEFEGVETRLQISYQQATDKNTGEKLNSFKCYIQVHERGHEGKILQSICRHGFKAGSKRNSDQVTQEYIAAIETALQ